MEMEREGMREPYKEPYTTRESLYPVSRIGWGAVIAGFFIATVTQILLNTLGIAIGLSAVGAEGGTSGTAIGIGAGIWTILSSVISVFVGAWVAGRYTSIPERGEGSLQGALVWSLSLIFFVWFATMGIGSALGGIMGMVGQGVQAGAQGAATQMGQADQDVGRGAGGEQMDRESMIQNLMNTTQMSREQAEKAVDQLSSPQMRQQAAETTAKFGAAAAWWFFITALLSLGAAIWGGNLGFSRRYESRPATART
jgi:hypothetical protein